MNTRAFYGLWLALCFIAAPILRGQTSTGEFSGTVTDASGAVVANVKITATSAETGAVRQVITDNSGGYVITLLPPGIYNLAAEAPGFRRTVQNNVELRVNQRAEPAPE